jgi:small subunit ribosomal protein S2
MVVEVKDCLENDVCFGHLSKRWNPHMKDFILKKKNNIHIIDARKTVEQLKKAYDKVVNVVSNGGKILFVGSKKQISDYIEKTAKEVSMPYVTTKWSAGSLTNFVTIRRIIKHIESTNKKIESSSLKSLPKKNRLIILRELEKQKKNFDGLVEMYRMPGAVLVIDVMHEKNAVKEAKIRKIPVIGIVDTNSDPTTVDYPIPANDDSLLSVKLIVDEIKNAIIEGFNNKNVNNILTLKTKIGDEGGKKEVIKNLDKNKEKTKIEKTVLIPKKNEDSSRIKQKERLNVKKNNKRKIETISGDVKNLTKELKNLKNKK